MILKTFTIDWDDYEQVRKAAAQLKTRKIELDPNHKTKAKKSEFALSVMDSCISIYNTDISHIYNDQNFDTLMRGVILLPEEIAIKNITRH